MFNKDYQEMSTIREAYIQLDANTPALNQWWIIPKPGVLKIYQLAVSAHSPNLTPIEIMKYGLPISMRQTADASSITLPDYTLDVKYRADSLVESRITTDTQGYATMRLVLEMQGWTPLQPTFKPPQDD